MLEDIVTKNKKNALRHCLHFLNKNNNMSIRYSSMMNFQHMTHVDLDVAITLGKQYMSYCRLFLVLFKNLAITIYQYTIILYVYKRCYVN